MIIEYKIPAPLDFDLNEADWELVVTKEKLVIQERNGVEVEEISLEGATKVESETLVGVGRLVVWYGEKPRTVVFYPLEYVPEYSTVASALSEYLEDGEKLEFKPLEKDFCPTCSRPLVRGSRVCPYCINSMAVLKRLAQVPPPGFDCHKYAFFALTAINLVPPQPHQCRTMSAGGRAVKLLFILIGGFAFPGCCRC